MQFTKSPWLLYAIHSVSLLEKWDSSKNKKQPSILTCALLLPFFYIESVYTERLCQDPKSHMINVVGFEKLKTAMIPLPFPGATWQIAPEAEGTFHHSLW